MNGLEFVAAVIASLAWPVVVVITLLTFKSPLGKVIERLRSAKGYGVEMDFEGKSDEAKDGARAVIDGLREQGAPATAGDVPDREPVKLPHDEDPTFAVIATWERIGEAMRDLVEAATTAGRFDADDAGLLLARRPPILVARALHRVDLVNERYVESVEALGRLRNVVAHGQRRLTREEAQSYIEAGQELIRATYAIRDFRFARPTRSDGTAPVPAPARRQAIRKPKPEAPPRSRE